MPGHREACGTGIYPYVAFRGCRTTMWSPRWVLLLLALALIPDPGVSQFGAQHRRYCTDCPPDIKKTEEPNLSKYIIDGKVNGYRICPLENSIRFQLNNEKKEIICAWRHLDWVKKLKDCLDGDNKKCSSNKEFSKGPNNKPSTTTVNALTTTTTTTTLATTKPSTQTWDHNIGHSTEPTEAGAASLVTTKGSDIIPQDPDKTNINSQQGNKSSRDPVVEDVSGKMKNMQTAVISLIAIVLVMIAVGVGLYCRKKKKNEFNSPCSLGYTAAPSQDPIVKDGDV